MRYLKLSWGEPTLFLLLFSTNGSVRGNNNGVYTQAHFYGIIDMTQNLLPKRLRVIGRNNLSSLKKLSSFENYKTENKNKDVKSSVLFHESPLVPGWGRKEWIRHPFVRFFFFFPEFILRWTGNFAWIFITVAYCRKQFSPFRKFQSVKVLNVQRVN